ncbi:MAG: DMT family transporter [Chloroflexota bacterium]
MKTKTSGLSERQAHRTKRAGGVGITLLATFCFGWAPIFGKLAYRAHVPPLTLAATRTVIAAGALWAFYLIFWRRLVRIGWRDLVGAASMGVVNGVGSLFYYTGLERVDASLAQLLYALYPIWVFVFLSAAGHRVSRLAVLRLGLTLLGVYLLTHAAGVGIDWLGVMLMIAAGAAYGWHLVLGQWTLADVDSRTVTLYALTAMALTVATARLVGGQPWEAISAQGWSAILLLALIPTALARLMVFTGLSLLGGVQASLLGVAELLVSLLMAFIILGERLVWLQWLGGAMMVLSVVLIGQESTQEVSWDELLRQGRWRELER